MTTRTDRNQVFGTDGSLLSEEVVEVDITAEVNERTIQDRLIEDLAMVDVITSTTGIEFTQSGVRDLQKQVKDLSRMNKRIIRTLLKSFDSAD